MAPAANAAAAAMSKLGSLSKRDDAGDADGCLGQRRSAGAVPTTTRRASTLACWHTGRPRRPVHDGGAAVQMEGRRVRRCGGDAGHIWAPEATHGIEKPETIEIPATAPRRPPRDQEIERPPAKGSWRRRPKARYTNPQTGAGSSGTVVVPYVYPRLTTRASRSAAARSLRSSGRSSGSSTRTLLAVDGAVRLGVDGNAGSRRR
jgi:hypothetical protein